MSFRSKSIFRELNYMPYNKHVTKLYDHAKDNIDFVQRLGLIRTLPLHQGCVNTLCWNETGDLLLSGSDDQHLVVTNGHTYQVMANYRTSHRANIFSAKFLPCSGDHNIVSCSGDGIILYTDLERPSETYYNQFNCHSGTTYEVITIPQDPFTFLSCGEDGTVRWFDLRIKERCKKPRCKEDILISHLRAISALCINPVFPHHLAIGSSDSTVRIFDRRMLSISEETENDKKTHHPVTSFTVPELEDRTYRITSLSYSPDGKDMLVSYSSDHLYLFSTTEPTHKELRKQGMRFSKKGGSNKRGRRSPPPVRRLRLRGDWSDTGPDARPERDVNQAVSIGQARPQLQATLMERMTNVLFRMLNDPLTRAALSAGGEDSLETNSSQNSQNQAQAATQTEEQEQTEEEHSERAETENDESMNEEETSDNDSSSETSRSTVASNNEQPSQTETRNEHTQTEAVYVQSPKPCTSTDNQEENDINNLKEQFFTLRDGFIEKHGSEPSVSLHYSDQSTTNSTIKLGVSNEVNRSNYNLPSSSGCSFAKSMPQECVSQQDVCVTCGNVVPTEQASRSTEHKKTESKGATSKTDESKTSTSTQAVEESTSESNVTSSSPRAKSSLVEAVTRNIRESRRTVVDEHEIDNISISSTGDVYVGQERQLIDRPTCTDIEVGYSDSDDEPNIINRSVHVNCNAKIYQPHVTQKYVGHRNARTMIKEATFWGNDYVMSGSDCGHVFVWDRATAKLVMLLQADHHVVNCIQPHPTLPLLATSGIDHDVKIWAPILEEANFDSKMAADLMERNEVMLEETRDTITVPAAFMIRMLACLNQIRRTGSLQRSRRRDETDQQDPGTA